MLFYKRSTCRGVCPRVPLTRVRESIPRSVPCGLGSNNRNHAGFRGSRIRHRTGRHTLGRGRPSEDPADEPAQRDGDGQYFGNLAEPQDGERDAEHDDGVHRDAHEVADPAVRHGVESDDPVDGEHGCAAGQRGDENQPDSLPDVGHPQVAEALVQQVSADDGTCGVAEAGRGAEEQHHLFRIGCDDRGEQRQADLDGGDAEDDPGGRPGLLAGVEHAQVDQDQRVRDKGERRPAHGLTQPVGVGRKLAEPVQRLAHPRPREGQEHDDRDHRDHRQSGGDGEIVDDRGRVTVGGITTESRHDRRQNRDAENAVRQLQHDPGLGIDRGARVVGSRRDVGGDDQTDLTDDDVEHDRGRHRAELLQARVEPPEWAQVDLLAAKRRDQRQDLRDDTGGDAEADDQQLRVRHVDRIDGDLTRHQEVDAEHREYHEVVEHRCPRTGFEVLSGVEHRREQAGEPVEHQRRQHQIGEGNGQVLVDLRITVEHQTRQQRRSDGCGQRHGAEQRDRNGEQASDEVTSAVGVLLFCAYQDRNDDRSEDGTEHQLGDHVRENRRDGERTGQAGTQGGRHGYLLGESGDPADEGRNGDRARRGQQRFLRSGFGLRW